MPHGKGGGLTLGPFPEGDIVVDLDVIFETELISHEGRDGDSTTIRVHSMADSSSIHQQYSTRNTEWDLLSHLLDKEYMTRSSGSSFFDRQDLLDFFGVG
jgi:hypothetical protein